MIWGYYRKNDRLRLLSGCLQFRENLEVRIGQVAIMEYDGGFRCYGNSKQPRESPALCGWTEMVLLGECLCAESFRVFG